MSARSAGGLALLLAASVSLLSACGGKACVIRPDALAELSCEQFSGPHSPTPIFNPPILLEPDSTVPAELPPMEAFNWRPAWPAASGVRLPEVTFYRESIYDRQSTPFWPGWGWTGSHFSQTFRSYRTGLIIR